MGRENFRKANLDLTVFSPLLSFERFFLGGAVNVGLIKFCGKWLVGKKKKKNKIFEKTFTKWVNTIFGALPLFFVVVVVVFNGRD